MSLYIDTSSLLKLVFEDPFSEATLGALVNEPVVFVSSLTELEAQTRYNRGCCRGCPRLLNSVAA